MIQSKIDIRQPEPQPISDMKLIAPTSSPTIGNTHVVGSAIGYEDKLQIVAASVSAEVLRAKTMFPNNFVNQHEAYAVILEEVDELWDEIKKNQRNYDLDAQRKEAVQAAAMLFRLLVELL